MIVNAVPEDRLQAEIIHSNTAVASGAFMFGALGGAIAGAVDAAIDAKRQKEADEVAAPLREVLADYHFSDEMHQAIEASIKPVTLLKSSLVTDINQHMKKNALKEKLKDRLDNASLYIESSYALSPDFKQLHIISKVHLYLDGYDMKQLFSYTADYKSKSLSGMTPSELQEQWRADGGAQLKAAIREGIQKVVLKIKRELAGGVDGASAAAKGNASVLTM